MPWRGVFLQERYSINVETIHVGTKLAAFAPIFGLGLQPSFKAKLLEDA